jgi:hypothetical protein
MSRKSGCSSGNATEAKLFRIAIGWVLTKDMEGGQLNSDYNNTGT